MVTHTSEPYNKACLFLVKQVNSDQDLPCPSIYWNLTKETKESSPNDKLLDLINTFTQTLLTDAYDPTTMYDFSRQLIVLFNFETRNFGDQAFELLHTTLYDALFHIFLTTANNESRKITYFIANNLRQKTNKLKPKIRDALTGRVFESLLNLCNNYFTISGLSKSAVEERRAQYLDIFAEFLDVFCRTLILATKRKEHISPCLKLAIAMCKLPLRENILGLVALILKKQNFFNNFAQHEIEALQILNLIMDIVNAIITGVANNRSQERQDLCNRAKDMAIHFVSQTRLNPGLVNSLYTKCLFNRLVCAPVENHTLDADFYKITHCLDESLVSFASYPTETDGFDRLASVFSIVVSPAILDQIQPFFTPHTHQPAVYYLRFFRRLATELSRQPSLEAALAKHILHLISSLRRQNAFFNLSGEPIVNYYILVEFTTSLLNKQATDEIVADRLVALCFDVYASNAGFKSTFDTMVNLASLNYPELLARYAQKLFPVFLKNVDESQYSYQIESVFQFIDRQVFEQFSSDIFTKILRSSRETVNSKNMALLLAIARHAGDFYLVRQDDELRLVTLQRLVVKCRQASLMNSFLRLVSVVVENLSASSYDIQQRAFEVFNSREKFYPLVSVVESSRVNGGQLKFKRDLMIEEVRLTDSVHVLCNLFFFAYKQTVEERVRRTLLADLVGLYAIIKESECVYVFNTLKKIGSLEGQIRLLGAHYKTFKEILGKEGDKKICEQLEILCEVIERDGGVWESLSRSDKGDELLGGLKKEKPLEDQKLVRASAKFKYVIRKFIGLANINHKF